MMKEEVFLRRNDSNGWVRGQLHHERALEECMKRNELGWISTPHVRGGTFTAFFTKRDTIYHYMDEYQQSVEITFMQPAKAAFINRITCAF
jgi:hypothetical protein